MNKMLVVGVVAAAAMMGCEGSQRRAEGERLTGAGAVEARPAPFKEMGAADIETLVTLAEVICPGEVVRGDGSQTTAPASCSVCPAGTAEEGAEGGINIQVAFVGDLRGDGAMMALVDGSGCEAHVDAYGGSYLLAYEDGAWRRRAYLPGERVRDCDPAWFRGAPSLLCMFSDIHLGYQHEAHYVAQIKGEGLVTFNGPMLACNVGGCPTAREACWETESSTIADADGDGQDDLVWTGKVTMSSLKGGIGESVLDECPDRESVPYDVEVVSVAQVYTLKDGSSAKMPAQDIKDAALKARVEALSKVPASQQ